MEYQESNAVYQYSLGDELVASQLRLLLAKKQMKDKYSYQSWLEQELERLKRNES